MLKKTLKQLACMIFFKNKKTPTFINSHPFPLFSLNSLLFLPLPDLTLNFKFSLFFLFVFLVLLYLSIGSAIISMSLIHLYLITTSLRVLLSFPIKIFFFFKTLHIICQAWICLPLSFKIMHFSFYCLMFNVSQVLKYIYTHTQYMI